MTTMRFCYCCRVHHAEEQMRLFTTRQGMRWRCLRSIAAATQPADQREAFGRQQTAINREAARRVAEFSLQRRFNLG